MVEKRFAFDLELFVVARQQGFRNLVAMPVIIRERFSSTVSLRAAAKLLIDTLAISYRLRLLKYYQRDLRAKPDVIIVDPPGQATADVDAHESIKPSESHSGERLRILILNWRDVTHPHAGGAEVYTHHVACEWIREGHTVTLFCAAVDGRPEREELDGLRIVRRGTRHSVYREAKRFYLNEGRGQYDLVIDEVNTRPFCAPEWVKDAPVLALIHQVCREIWFYETSLPVALLGRFILEPLWLRKYRKVTTVTVSESSKESLRRYGLTNVVVVPEGHDFQCGIAHGTKEVMPTVVFLGRLNRSKRPDHAIKAFTRFKESAGDAQMWIIGSGPMEDKLRSIAPSTVKFLGKIS
ncbi:MAG: glycosyltransferase family 4 protein, partial [Acidimicrobiales bacterium]